MNTPNDRPLTPDDLTAIRERVNTAMPGPWQWDSYNRIVASVPRGHALDYETDADRDEGHTIVAWIGEGPVVHHGDELRVPQAKANARLIAAAPSDILCLLSQVERLQSEHDAYRAIVERMAGGFTLAYAEDRNAEVCVLCYAALARDDFAMDSKRDVAGWYEQHIQHAPDCPVTKARVLLGRE
jgi:hypothetical protein